MAKRKIGKYDYASLIIPAGVVVGGYLILKNFNLFGGGANTDNNTAIDNNATATVAAAIADAKSKGIGQTVSDAVLSSAATYIYETGVASTVDMDGIVYKVIQVNTLTDLLRLVQLFGTKKVGQGSFSPCYYLGVFCQSVDLATFLRMCLDAAHLASINNFLANQSINYSF